MGFILSQETSADLRAALQAFLATLNVIATFWLRSIEEVHAWSLSRTICQLFAFPKEDAPLSAQPRLANLSALKLVFFKYIAANVLLCEYRLMMTRNYTLAADALLFRRRRSFA